MGSCKFQCMIMPRITVAFPAASGKQKVGDNSHRKLVCSLMHFCKTTQQQACSWNLLCFTSEMYSPACSLEIEAFLPTYLAFFWRQLGQRGIEKPAKAKSNSYNSGAWSACTSYHMIPYVILPNHHWTSKTSDIVKRKLALKASIYLRIYS